MSLLDAVPEHLPARLTISLWDFSWYTQAGPGEPFADLDGAMVAAVERGYNTIRICAMPFLLFGDHDIDASRLDIEEMAPGVGHATRWYNVRGGVSVDGRARLRELFETARRRGVRVIVSSWEYQQSPAFSRSDNWYRALEAIPPEERFLALAKSLARLVDYLRTAGGLDRQIAYLELHNEVDLSHLRDAGGGSEADPYWPQKPFNERAIEWLREQCPEHMVTTSYGITPYLDMPAAAENSDVAHFHVYVYGALGALERWAGVRGGDDYPSANLRSLLRDGAPEFGGASTGLVPSWRYDATGISPGMFYTYDNVDPRLWDRWLYEKHHLYAEAMRWAIDDKLTAISAFARQRGIPAVVGEGWIGYTPLHSEYEDGPLGTAIAEYAVQRAVDLGLWGVVLGSNSAPHHPGWRNVAWQQHLNRFLFDTAIAS
ncbi:cellulase-like family protein [Microbacterium aquimaris]|uniref:Cellulase-like family protein n=1 Tax=Microbacterium aquimaris TaxID=459816 RepID=A0ABU5N411_9MICO|nr:cellulase-like family protein [Microbacterium aquimaris]MDZ8160829.1 cellulase-like family protein [Microbacterium aquimaris]